MTALPHLGAAVPRRGNAFTRWLGRSVLALMGWRVEGEMPDLPKFVVAVGPHTSNWDFVVGAAAMLALDLRLAYLGKHTLFRGPLAPLMRWLGGIPVDRSSPHGVVGEAVEAFARMERRILAIAPEGTRRRGAQVKSGFLHIARGAGVPVAFATWDYATRIVRLGPTVWPGADIEAERARAQAHFAAVTGKRPR